MTDPTRLKVVGWLTEKVGASAALALEATIFDAAAEPADGYKRCFKVASKLLEQGNVPDGWLVGCRGWLV
jgi:hypothetical protein